MAHLSKRNREQRRLEEAVSSLQVTRETHYSGPLPAPEQLAQYNEVMPGLADRIVRMAEGEATHRRSLEQQLIQIHIEDTKENRAIEHQGQHYAAAISIIMIGCGTAIILAGHTLTGGLLTGATLLTLVAMFIFGRKYKPLPLDTKTAEPDIPQ
jgi:uncharacterized membrane protein